MATVLELMNDFFDRVLEGGPSTRHLEAMQAPAAGPAECSFAGDGFRRESVAAHAAKGCFNQFDAIPARLTHDSKSEIFDNALAELASGGE